MPIQILHYLGPKILPLLRILPSLQSSVPFQDYTKTQTHRLPPFSLRHTYYSHSPSDTHNTPYYTQSHRLLQFSIRYTDYYHSYSDTLTSLILTQTTLILTLKRRLIPFSLRPTDYFNSHSRQLPFSHKLLPLPFSRKLLPFLQRLLPFLHRLLPCSHRYFQFFLKTFIQDHSNSDTQSSPLLAQRHILLPFSLRHT